MRTLFANNDIY